MLCAHRDWEEFERNRKQLAANAYGKAGDMKLGRGGPTLLAGYSRALVAGAACQ